MLARDSLMAKPFFSLLWNWFFSETFLTIVTRFLILFSGFFASILTARYLGPAGRGDYFFVTTLSLLITQFAHLGLASSNTWLVAKQPELLRKLTINSFWIALLTGFFISAVIILLTSEKNTGLSTLLLLAPASIFFLLGSNLLVGMDKITRFNQFQAIGNMGIVCLMVISGYCGFQAGGFLLLNALGWTCIALVLLSVLLKLARENTASRQVRFDIATFNLGARYGFRIYLVTLLGFFVLKGNIFLLKYFVEDATLGYYSVASQLGDCLIIIPNSVGLVLFPKLIKQENNRWELMKKQLKMVSMLMLVLCLVTGFLAEPVIALLFGEPFLPAATILYWLLPGIFFLSIISIISQYLSALGCPVTLIFLWVLAFILVLVCGWFFIPLWQGSGAAMAISLSWFFLAILIGILAKYMYQHGVKIES